MDKTLAILAAFALAAMLIFATGCTAPKSFGSVSQAACKDAGGRITNTSITGYMDCTGGRKKIGDVMGSTEKDLLICCV